MSLLVVIFLIVCLLAIAGLYGHLAEKPLNELRRQAKLHPQMSAIYKLSAYKNSSRLFLLILGSLLLILIMYMLSGKSWWLAALVFLLLAVFLWAADFSKHRGVMWSLAKLAAAISLPVVGWCQPVLSRLAGIKRSNPHTAVYEKEDLLDLLRRQAKQPDNRLTPTELKLATSALTFGDKKVGRVMTPRKQVRWVAADEAVSPLVMDELFDTGFSRFPVVKSASKTAAPEVVGTLHLRDLLKNLEGGGKIRDIMRKDAGFINEMHDLRLAADAFLKSGHHLLTVVNNFEEVIGILTLDDLIEQILGEKIAGEFDRYDDLRAVAGHDPEAIDSQQQQTTVE